MAAVTSGKVLSSHPISINVCGEEEVRQLKGDKLGSFYDVGSGRASYAMKEYLQSSDEVNCPIRTVSLTTLTSTPLTSFQSKVASISNNVLEISKASEANFSFLVVAQTSSG